MNTEPETLLDICRELLQSLEDAEKSRIWNMDGYYDCSMASLARDMADYNRRIREAIDRQPVPVVRCGCCDCYHRADYYGDCRNDGERFADIDDAESRLDREVLEIADETV